MPATNTATNTATNASAKDTIIKVATDLFSRASFEAVSINDIAKAAQVSKANIFHHFINKQALFSECINSLALPELDILKRLYDMPISSSEKIWWKIKYSILSFSSNKTATNLLDQAFSRLIEDKPTDNPCQCQARLGELIKGLDNLFRQGQENGEFRSDFHAEMASLMLVSVTNFYTHKEKLIAQHSPHQPFSKVAFARRIYLFIMAGFIHPKRKNYFVPADDGDESLTLLLGPPPVECVDDKPNRSDKTKERPTP